MVLVGCRSSLRDGKQARPDGSHHHPTGSLRLSRRAVPSLPSPARNARLPKTRGGGQVILCDELFSFLIPRMELFFVSEETENKKSPVGVGQTFPLSS